MSTGARKIPGHCPTCGNALSRSEMEEFLKLCEGWGCDPIEFAFRGTPPGIRCGSCMVRTIADGAEHGDAAIQPLVRKMRLYCLGVEELPDGKPVRWH
jgi:hypothetical protein